MGADLAQVPGPLAIALADRYQFGRELGSGGMATVFLAHDLKHDRQVAVKVLRAELAASLGTERFLAEIRLTARLQHPYIVALFDSGEVGGFLYYVMPYIAGESLRTRLEREKRLDVDAMLVIARPVAQALAYAHELGVVHRDIKPENILLSRGQAFVTDFGIARAVAGSGRLTATGLAIGTPAYMSPEQALGEEAVDARSDVYALGCVIYEMLVGEPPFSGPTAQALTARRLVALPPHLTGFPTAIDDVVRQALATAPQDRFATTAALDVALVEAARKRPAQAKSIVVLPFANLSPDPDNAYFADGMTEELITALSKVQALRVISRTSAMQFKGTGKGVPAITRQLDVQYALEGSVRRAGSDLRITAQLIDASTDVHLWAETYRGIMDDVFGIQESVARSIVDALKVTLDTSTSARLAERPIRSAAAYDNYLRAMQSMWQFTEVGLTRAVEHLERGLAIEDGNAVLHGALAYVNYQHANVGIEPIEEFRARARVSAERALAADPETSLAHLAIGLLSAFESPKTGIRSLQRALRTDDTNVEALIWLAIVLGHAWRPDVGRSYLARARALDPLHPMMRWLGGYLLALDGRFAQGAGVLREGLKSGRDLITKWFLAMTLAYEGRCEEAGSMFEEVCSEDPGNPVLVRIGGAFGNIFAGDADAARRFVAELDDSAAVHGDFGYALWVADCHALLGDTDGALDWLQRSVSLGMMNYPFLSVHDPFLKPLRAESRFLRLMERVKREWETFDA